MTFVPFPFGVKVEMLYSLEGSVVENVIWYAMDEDPDETAMNDLAESIGQQWDNGLKDVYSLHIALTGVRVTDMHADNAPSLELAFSPAKAGTVQGEALPANCAVQIALLTQWRGRSYRGRIFMPGVSESVCAGSYLTTSYQNSVATKWDLMRSHSTETGAAVLQVASQFSDGLPRTTGLMTTVTGIRVSDKIASQRRRLPGRGR